MKLFKTGLYTNFLTHLPMHCLVKDSIKIPSIFIPITLFQKPDLLDLGKTAVIASIGFWIINLT